MGHRPSCFGPKEIDLNARKMESAQIMSKRRIRNIILTILLVVSPALCQEIVNPAAVTFIGSEQAAGQVVKSVFAVQAGQIDTNGIFSGHTIGSGFFITNDKQFIGPGSLILGVTCNHVVNALKPNEQLFVGLDTSKIGYIRVPATPVVRDTTNDVAILNIDLNANIDASRIGWQNMFFDTNSVGNSNSIVDGRGVLIVGYPLGLGLNGNDNRPIVRFGMIAQDSGTDTFLIDGTASHGNSGSPVTILTPHKIDLIGMVRAFASDTIVLYGEDGQLNATLPYNSGLTVAVKIGVIQRDLDVAFDSLHPH